MRKKTISAVGLWVLSVSLMATAGASASPLKANNGSIQSLTAQGATQPGNPIDVSSTVLAADRINNSNLYYVLSDPSGTIIDTSSNLIAAPGNRRDVYRFLAAYQPAIHRRLHRHALLEHG